MSSSTITSVRGSPEAGPPGRLSDLSILLVDEDDASVARLAAVLRDAGCDTRSVRSAEDALVALDSYRPDAIVFELVLPLMSGLVFAQRLAHAPSARGIALIAMSAIDGPEAVRLAHGAGCVGFIRKPIDAPSLPGLVAIHLGVRR